MLVLGLLLMGATGAFIGLLIADNTDGPVYHATILGQGIATVNSLAVFLAGIALMVILGLAFGMVKAGSTRAARRRELLRSARRPAPRAAPEPYETQEADGRSDLRERPDAASGLRNGSARNGSARNESAMDDTADVDGRSGREDEAAAGTRRSRRRLRFGH